MAPQKERNGEVIINIFVDDKGKTHGVKFNRGMLTDMSMAARNEFKDKPVLPIPNMDIVGLVGMHAIRVVLQWMLTYHRTTPTLSISVADLELKMGEITVRKVLDVFRVLCVCGVVPAKADNALRTWLEHTFNQVGITAEEIEMVMDAFPLAQYPRGGVVRKRDLCPKLLAAINEYEWDNYPESYAAKGTIGEIRKRRADINDIMAASAHKYRKFRSAKTSTPMVTPSKSEKKQPVPKAKGDEAAVGSDILFVRQSIDPTSGAIHMLGKDCPCQKDPG